MDYASSILGFLPGGRRSTGISQLLDKLETYLPPAQIERVRDAYEFGALRHQGQKRLSGEPYITHPVAVADILADLHLDADTLIAAMLGQRASIGAGRRPASSSATQAARCSSSRRLRSSPALAARRLSAVAGL